MCFTETVSVGLKQATGKRWPSKDRNEASDEVGILQVIHTQFIDLLYYKGSRKLAYNTRKFPTIR